MLSSKHTALKPLLESQNGIHLTAYLVNRGDLIDLKSQLKTVLLESTDCLNDAMAPEEVQRFLEPLESLLDDARMLKRINGNIGLFRTFDSFRVLNVPVDVEFSSQIATSFHVKPLLRWLQADREFLLLGLEKDCARLYLGSQDSFKLVDSILFPESFMAINSFDEYLSLRDSKERNVKQDDTFAWLNDWLNELTVSTKPRLFVAGEKSLVAGLHRHLDYKNTIRSPIANSFGKHNVADLCADIRSVLKRESRAALERSLLEFKVLGGDKRLQRNIFQISKAVIQGKVRKLVVTDEMSIFGTIDKRTGGLALHPFDLDHEDDCILDDLAQMVLSQGGEVVIAKRDDIPNGRPILAILDDDGTVLNKRVELER